jgi:hypothetical protein
MSYFMRAEAGFRCERCGAPEGSAPGHTLTVNLVNTVLTYSSRANLVVLCRHCQGRLRTRPMGRLINQLEMFEPFELRWLQPHLEALGIPIPGARLKQL